MSRTINNYCPECKQKKLSHRQYRSTGKCFWHCFNSDCGLKIEHDDRDAEISDYYGLLDRMARLSPEDRIGDYFLQHEARVYQKGLEILFIGENLFVAKHKHKTYGVCAALYWNGDTVDKDDEDIQSPRFYYQNFDHDAAKHLEYQGQPVSRVIDRHPPQILWRARGGERFKGRMSKSLKAQIVEWATGLDAAIPALVAEARSLVAAWKEERNEIFDYLKERGVTLGRFNQHKKKSVEISLRKLTLEECRRLDKVLPKKLKIDLVKGVVGVTTEQAESVVKLLGVVGLKVKASVGYAMTPKKAKKVADALKSAVQTMCLEE